MRKLFQCTHVLNNNNNNNNSAECQVALRWWLGLDTSGGSLCPHCPDIALDPLGHHAASCRHGGDVVARHNHLRDIFANFCDGTEESLRPLTLLLLHPLHQ